MKKDIYNPEFVRSLFNRMSSSYERMNYITSFGFSLRWRKDFLNPFYSTNDKVEVIDLMTGMGETWSATRRKFPNANISALDFSDGMLSYAEIKNKKSFGNKVSILNQDMLNNQLESNHYDYVTCAFGLKTFDKEQLEVLAKETQRILKPGGQFSFIEVSKPNNAVLTVLYKFYLGKAIPILGRILLGNPIEYKMLCKYTNNFNDSKKASEIFHTVGLETEYCSYFYGCATGFSGVKKRN
jgi:ubiquinone/menaquinone biosynthesis methyltransferase